MVQEQRFEEAVPHLAKTIELGGPDGQTYGSLGIAYLSMEKFLSAEIALRQAALLNPDKETWKQALVKCMIEMEHYSAALRLLDEMLDKNPDKASLWTLQAGVYLQNHSTLFSQSMYP